MEIPILRLRKVKHITLIIGFAKKAPDGVHRGGVLIMCDDTTITHTSTKIKEGGIVKVDLVWGGKNIEFAGIYAPAQALERINFLQALRNKINKNTITGGDWNCVPDITLDIHSSNPLAYRNIGSRMLADVMNQHKLVDERREQLGNEAEYTRSGNTNSNTNNNNVSSRIDRWYIPDDDSLLWTFEVDNTFIFKSTSSDHSAVIAIADNQNGELGHDRKTINENLIQNRNIQQAIIKITEEAFKGNMDIDKKWKLMNNKIKDFLMKKTAESRKKDNKEINKKTAMLHIIQHRKKTRGSTPQIDKTEKVLQNEIYNLKHPETQHNPTERGAMNMYERSDVCSRAMFRPYKAQAKQQWINSIKKNDWQEGVEPNFNAGTPTTQHTKDVGNELKKTLPNDI